MRGAVRRFEAPLFSARLCAVCLVFQRELFSASISKANASTLHHWETTSAHASDRHAMRRHRTLIAHHTIYYPILSPHLRRLGRLLPEDFCGGDELYGVVVSARTDE